MTSIRSSSRCLALAALSLCIARAVATAQSGAPHSPRVGVELGLSGQQDNTLHDGVGLSLVGLLAGVRWLPGGEARIGVSNQLTVFPVVAADQVRIVSGGTRHGDAPHRPLFVDVTMARGEVGARDGEHGWAAIGGVGAAAVLLTPRASSRVVPVLEVGVRYALVRGVAIGASLQCGTQRLGETRCLAPLTFGWALSR